MPPALTRAASTGVDAYALFRAIDIDDSSKLKPKDYRDKLYDEIHRRKRDARRDQQKLFARPSNTILVEHEETMPEPF